MISVCNQRSAYSSTTQTTLTAYGVSDQTSQVMPSVKTDPSDSILQASVHIIVSNVHNFSNRRGSLVDRGANGGILGDDAKVIRTHTRTVDVTGIDNHEVNGLKIVDAAARVETNRGAAILILHQYAYHGIGRTIHSAGQIEYYKNTVDDRSIKVGGRQCIRTLDGYILALDIWNGLPYLRMVPPSDQEFEDLPHVILTPADAWDPCVLDNDFSQQEGCYSLLKDMDQGLISHPFDEFGNYLHREPLHVMHASVNLPQPRGRRQFEIMFHQSCHMNDQYLVYDAETIASGRIQKAQTPNYEELRPYFLHVPAEKVRHTFNNTTQFASNIVSGKVYKQTIKSPYPAHNVYRRNEPVATDTIFAAVPAIDSGGQKTAQIFVGRRTLVVDVYGMGSSKEFVNTLEDVIRKRGAMDKLISDSATTLLSHRVLDILRSLCIDNWQSEANYQHQNFAEHRYKFLKRNVNWIMNLRNVPAECWLLCTQWVADVMNHTAERSLGWRTPLQVLTGQTPDISILLVFLFYDVVYVARYKDATYSGQPGSPETDEIRGHFVGFSWDVGHSLTFLILTDDTKKVISRSQVRLAKEGENNLKLDMLSDDVRDKIFIQSKRDSDPDAPLPTIDVSVDPFTVTFAGEDEPAKPPDPPLAQEPLVETVDLDNPADLPDHCQPQPPGRPNPTQKPYDFSAESLDNPNPTVKGLTPEQMIKRSFLMPPQPDGTRLRAEIQEVLELSREERENNPDLIKFRAIVNDDYEEIVAYNDIVDYIEQDESWDGIWKFREILDHQGPLRSDDPRYKGSKYNVLVLWETGEQSWEPLHVDKNSKWTGGIYNTDRVSVAIYAVEHGLLDTEGWQLPGIKKIAKTQKRLTRNANQAKLHSFRNKPVYMYGFQVPRNHQQAMELDAKNGNTRWRDAEIVELKQIDEYDTFDDRGKDYRPPKEYKKITVHLVYAVKHDGRHKARLVAGGHLTDTPVDSVYSSVVSLRGIRMIVFLAEHNGLELWATDIGNAYLESVTQEKVYVIAGPEFGDREGHVLLIHKALYGLKSSGLRWHERFSDVLRSMNFFLSKAENDIWMRDMGDHYEYIAVYVDDLALASKNPQAIVDVLTKKHNFKLKGTGPISFHLGCDFFRDSEDTLCYAPRKYIEKMIASYERIFGSKPKQYTSPLVKGDHPELDTSELLDDDDIKKYQSMIGALQWAVQIGRFDVAVAVMTMSRFRALPRQGHLERVQRIYGYLSKMRHGTIRIRTEKPDFSGIPEKHYDWENTCYPGAHEVLPTDAPPPKGKPIVLSTYVDANLYHDMISGRSVSGILHFVNKTPWEWYAKLQTTVETATFGSEYICARTGTDQAVDARTSFRYLGAQVEGPNMMFGDNETVVNTASIPHSKLHKRHNALSYHRVREAIAAKIIRFHHIPGPTNPADILSKHWDYATIWPILKPILFHEGDTSDLTPKTSEESSNGKAESEDPPASK